MKAYFAVRERMRYGFLSGNVLKGIGAVTMVIDHLGAVVLKGYVNSHVSGLTQAQIDRLGVIYGWLRSIGRISFPLFVFLLVEGFFHTKDRKKYGQRLFVFALLSELPYDLAIYGRFCTWERQNVLFTLFLGLRVMEMAWRARVHIEGKDWRGRELPAGVLFGLQCLIFAAGAGVAHLCRTDYSYKGIALAAVFHFFHAYCQAAALAGACLFSENVWYFPAFVLILFYDPNRRRKANAGTRRWFYLFYPLHLLVLAGIVWIVG